MKKSSSKKNYHIPGEYSDLIFIAALTISVIATGILGYELIEGWHFLDALYMTIITLATIGFSEVHPLSEEGRIFTIFLIVVGVGLVAVLFSTVTQRVIQRHLFFNFREKRMLEQIEKLKNHTIFCGFGRLTRIAAAELRTAGVSLVIVDRDAARVEEARQMGYLALHGDSTLDEVLMRAGINRAQRLVSLLPKDADNLYVILTSRELRADLFILSRAEDDAGEKRLTRAGANKVIAPYRVGGQKIAEGIMRPYVTDFLDLAVSGSNKGLQIEEIKIPSNCPVKDQTLKEALIRQKTNVIVAAIVSPLGQMLFNPDSLTKIEEGATFIAIGVKENLIQLEGLLTGIK
jgi:voltage-gated potassium channel